MRKSLPWQASQPPAQARTPLSSAVIAVAADAVAEGRHQVLRLVRREARASAAA